MEDPKQEEENQEMIRAFNETHQAVANEKLD